MPLVFRFSLFARLLLTASVLCLPCTLAVAATPAVVPVLSADGLGKGSIPLEGPWQFHLGDDPSFASPSLDDATGHGGWEQSSADKTWGEQGHRSYVGYAWYRRHIHLSPAPGAPANFAIYIPHIDDIYEIYWNGVPVAHYGKFPPKPIYYYQQVPQTFGLGLVRDGVLAFRVWKAPLVSFDTGLQGGFAAPPVVGSPAAIADQKTASNYRWLRSRQYRFGILSLTGFVFVLSLFGWLRDHSQRVLLWMASFTFAPLGIFFLAVMRWPVPLPFLGVLGWLQPVLSTGDVGLWLLLLWLLKLNENPRLARVTRILAVVAFVVASLDGLTSALNFDSPRTAYLGQLADTIFTAITSTVEMFPFVLVAFAFRKRLDLARWLVAIVAFLTAMLQTLRITLTQGSRYTHWTISQKISTPLFVLNGNPFTLQTILDTLLLCAIIYAVYSYTREAWRKQKAVQDELRSAQELQQVLIPEKLPELPGYAVTSAYRPAQEVGGDFFQVIPGDGSTLVVLGDVSGKGLRAAMTVSLIVGTLRTLAEFNNDPAEVLAGLNRRLHGRLHGGFATCVILRLDTNGTCVMANAGHPAPWVNDHEIELPGALPLGLLATSKYDEVTLQLAVGDHLLVYTDGLLEARTASGEIFSFERLRELVATRPNAEQATLVAQNFGQDDDITVLTLTRLAAGEESTTQLTAPSLSAPLSQVFASA